MNLKTLRRRLKLTQAEAAEHIGVKPNTWARWERGELTPSSAAQTLLQMLPQIVQAKKRKAKP